MSDTAPKTIGNPASWVLQSMQSASHGTADAIDEIRGASHSRPRVRSLDMADLTHALRAGWDDFKAARSDAMFLVFIYPLIGLAMVVSGFHLEVLPLLVPMVMGFALVGPAAAIGLYEMSRRREAGQPMGIYGATLGPESPATLSAFVRDVFYTSSGWTMIIVGTLVGAAFAYAALAISIVSFPLLLDRHVGLPIAVATSLEVMRKNRVVCLAWGGLSGPHVGDRLSASLCGPDLRGAAAWTRNLASLSPRSDVSAAQ